MLFGWHRRSGLRAHAEGTAAWRCAVGATSDDRPRQKPPRLACTGSLVSEVQRSPKVLSADLEQRLECLRAVDARLRIARMTTITGQRVAAFVRFGRTGRMRPSAGHVTSRTSARKPCIRSACSSCDDCLGSTAVAAATTDFCSPSRKPPFKVHKHLQEARLTPPYPKCAANTPSAAIRMPPAAL